jgi:geranylgeranyl diphosphate synthase type II
VFAPARVEAALHDAVDRITADGCPPGLAEAVRYAVFPAGNRLRPRLTLAVADAVGHATASLAEAAAVALEFLHCASLVQDDLPAFDNAQMRRGRPALHLVHGEATAVLAADALIIGAFDTIARSAGTHVEVAAALTIELARGTGSPLGAVAGQAWEGEDDVDLAAYHRTKTAALFESATAAGAIIAGQEPSKWRKVGYWLGRAYQIADDIADQEHTGDGSSDLELGRPNAFHEFGHEASHRMLERCISNALQAVPPCRGEVQFRDFLAKFLERFRPSQAADAFTSDTTRAR